jgi:hypothetical protein
MGLVIPGAPFSISSDASLWVVDRLGAADGNPKLAGLVPGLSYAIRSTMSDGKGGLLEVIPYPHFRLGWHRPEEAGPGDGTWVDVFDRRLFLHAATLERLRGRRLSLHKVESTLATRTGRARHVLRADAEGKGIFKFLDT